METGADQVRAFLLALGFHALLLLAAWLSGLLSLPTQDVSAAGEPIQATLQVSAADLRRAKAAVTAAEKAKPAPEVAEPEAPKPQPVPVRTPQTSDEPVQVAPQAPQDRPDTVDQERISRLAIEQAEKLEREEQEERRRQEQVDLTEDLERQRLAERKQQLRELQEIRAQREAATRRTRLEEQRQQQLADLASSPREAPAARPAPPVAGNRGADDGLLARYKAEMQLTAEQNWNHSGAPELTRCKVSFTQIPGGEVINVEFMSCPYDAQGREFVDRALRKTPMPYSGFESVFTRKVELTFCYPREECER